MGTGKALDDGRVFASPLATYTREGCTWSSPALKERRNAECVTVGHTKGHLTLLYFPIFGCHT